MRTLSNLGAGDYTAWVANATPVPEIRSAKDDGSGNRAHWDPEAGQQIIKPIAVTAGGVGATAIVLDILDVPP
jgi:hypothetical protein